MKSETNKKRVGLGCLGYASIAIIVIWALYSATMNELDRIPDRDATANMEEYGLVTIRFSTDPYPPNPADAVKLSFRPMDSRQKSVSVDQITYEYGLEDSENPIGSGVAQILPDSKGSYMGEAMFPNTGRWWIAVKISIGDVQSDVNFKVDVKAAQ